MADARLAAVAAAVAVVVGLRIASFCRHGGRGRVAIQHLEDNKREHGEKVGVLGAWTG